MSRHALLITMLLFTACSDSSPTSPTAESLNGVWRIISIQPPSQAAQAAPAGALYQVEFGNGQASMRVDCNTCTGPFALSGSTLTIGPAVACTRAACATAAYESAVVAMLSGDHQTARTLHNLTLSSTRGTILLQR